MWLLKVRRLAKEIGREALILLFAVRDPATPMPLKAASVAALAYVFSPFDLLPDVPVVGWVDDLLVISLGFPYLIRKLPPAVHLRASNRADRLLASLGVEPNASKAQQADSTANGRRRAAGKSRAAAGGAKARASKRDAVAKRAVTTRPKTAATARARRPSPPSISDARIVSETARTR